MNQREYSLSAGVVLVAASIIFFLLPSLLNYDAFLPVILSILSLLVAIAFFFIGVSDKSK